MPHFPIDPTDPDDIHDAFYEILEAYEAYKAKDGEDDGDEYLTLIDRLDTYALEVKDDVTFVASVQVEAPVTLAYDQFGELEGAQSIDPLEELEEEHTGLVFHDRWGDLVTRWDGGAVIELQAKNYEHAYQIIKQELGKIPGLHLRIEKLEQT